MAVFTVFGLYAAAQGQTINENRPKNQGIKVSIAVSNQRVLPFESVAVVLSMKNETSQTIRVVAMWRVWPSIAELQGRRGGWRSYTPHYEPHWKPPLPSAKIFAPGESQKMFSHLDYEEPTGRHVFSHPGRYKLLAAAAYNEGFLSDEIEITVQEPHGTDARAYKFLRRSNVHRFFSEQTVYKYPRTGRDARALKSFITAFDGSEYSNHARLGLALMWMQGVNNRIDLTRAERLLTRLTQKAEDPLLSRVHYYLGTIWLKRGDNARASEAFQAVLRGKPDPFFAALAEQQLPPSR